MKESPNTVPNGRLLSRTLCTRGTFLPVRDETWTWQRRGMNIESEKLSYKIFSEGQGTSPGALWLSAENRHFPGT